MSGYPGHAYPNQQYHESSGDLGSYAAGGLPSPRPGTYDDGQGYMGANPYYGSGHSSQPSLPGYASDSYHSPPLDNKNGLSPLNPSARPGYVSGASSRYSGGGGPNGAHPLSNAHYAESTHTLHEGPYDTIIGDGEIANEKRALAQSHHHLATPSSDTAVDAMAAPPAGTAYRRPTAAGYNAGPRGPLENAYRRFSGAYIGDSGADPRHTKYSANAAKRLGYLDGLKFIAACIFLNGTMFDAVLEPNDYTAIQRGSPLYIFRSTGFAICLFLLMSGRALITPLWDIPPPNAASQAPSGEKSPTRPSISWPRLTKAMLVRPFRFILPVVAVTALQWGLAANGKLDKCNDVGMDEPHWGLIRNFGGFTTMVFDLFTYFEQDTLAGKTFGGNLWTTPWLFQGSYAAYVTHLMMGNLSSNRYWVYGILAAFSWTTYNFFYLVILGVFIADLGAHGHLNKIRKKGILVQSLLHVLLIAIACVTQFIGPIRDHLNDGMATINVQDHPEITFADSIFAVCILMVVETSTVWQMVFGNIVMRTLGRLAAGIYLLSAPFLFSIVPNVASSMNGNGSSPSSILGVSWLVLFGCSVLIAIPFHLLIELPSKLVGEYFADFVEYWGLDDEERAKKRTAAIKSKSEKKGISRVLS